MQPQINQNGIFYEDFIRANNLSSVSLGKTSMHLVVDAAFAHLNLEETTVAPSLIPRVDTEPVVKPFFNTPSDNFNGMTSKS